MANRFRGRHAPVLSMREAIREWRSLGGEIRQVRCSGEIRMIHPDLPRYLVVSARRRDASAAVMGALAKLWQGK